MRTIATEKRCIACRIVKPAAEFFRHAYTTKTGTASTRFESACKACKEARRRSWRIEHYGEYREQVNASRRTDEYRDRRNQGYDPFASRVMHLRATYGLTVEQFDTRLKAQDGRCAICRDEPKTVLHVDHDHVTTQVRGLLCHNRNVALGLLHDDLGRAEALVAYLRQYASSKASTLAVA